MARSTSPAEGRSNASTEAGGERVQDQRSPVAPAGSAMVGQRLRSERERQKIGVRELARRVNVSASMISQIELGRATPSVGTLYAIVNELNISLDSLFLESGDVDDGSAPSATGRSQNADDDAGAHDARPHAVAPPPPPSRAADRSRPPAGPLVRGHERQTIHLASGVTWERMTPETDHEVDFLHTTYNVGGESTPERSLMRHAGREYHYLLEGKLGVTVGFDTYELTPGDAISFDSTIPHRLFNAGDVPTKAISLVVGRNA